VPIITKPPQPIEAIVAEYQTAFAAALVAFLLKKKNKGTTKDALKQAIMTFMLAAFLSGHSMSSGGNETLADEDQAYIDARLLSEVGYSAALVDDLSLLDTSKMSEAELRALANDRATGYGASLYGVYNEGLLRGNRNVFLTLDGLDGQESCSTCRRLKGRRKRAQWWITNNLIPGQAGNANYECRGYRCLHYLRTDNGEPYTVQHRKEAHNMPDTTMQIVRREYTVKLLERRENGGRILINTGAVDRQRDRVFPMGARLDNYQKNPIVQWGHNYRDPFATIGRTTSLTKSPDGLVADFELRPPANEADPQNIVLLLWNGDWVKTASIGFLPYVGKPNEVGGNDFIDWELLEWSIVPIPANQEALRLAMKAIDAPLPDLKFTFPARDGEMPILAPDEGPTPAPAPAPAEAPLMRAWIRKVTVVTDMTRQHYANFMLRRVDVPEEATVLVMDDELGTCEEMPHPDRGTTVTLKTVLFVPPLQLANGRSVYTVERRECPDEELMAHEQWKIEAQSDILDYLPAADMAKAIGIPFDQALPVDILTDATFARAVDFAQRLHRRNHTPAELEIKSGRVLSKKNENKLKDARTKLDEVLAEVETQPEQDGLINEDDLRRMGEKIEWVSILCPFECGMPTKVISWGMYSCHQCHGTFEVIPMSESFDVPFSDAVKDPSLIDVSAIEPGTLIKGPIPAHTTPKAPPDMAWDAGAVMRMCPNEARALRRIHAWVDSEGDPNAKSSYKLPHHLVDGRVVLRGVNNAKARLPQSNIPMSDHPGCEAHLNRHQAQFNQAAALRDYARALSEAADELDGDHHLSDEDERALVTDIRELLNLTKEVLL
jgi:hypothetical protein